MTREDVALRVLIEVLQEHERLEVVYEGKRLSSIQVRNVDGLERIEQLSDLLGHSFSKETLSIVPYAELKVEDCLISIHA